MNAVRKHLSTIKGGRLAAAAHPAQVFSLIVSDIPGDNPAFVASGPTVTDETTREDALRIVERYNLDLPKAALARLHSDKADAPKPSDALFAGHEHHLIASAAVSLEATAKAARDLGVEAVILSDAIEGEAREVAHVHAALAKQVLLKNQPFTRPVVIFLAGKRP